VTSRTPPAFLWHTDDDEAVPVENSILFFEAMKKAKVPGELHVFAHGPHGVGSDGPGWPRPAGPQWQPQPVPQAASTASCPSPALAATTGRRRLRAAGIAMGRLPA
jgi:acetyl esterase/lipase